MSSANLCHIRTITLNNTGVSNFDFDNIPQNFTDLYITYSVRLNANDVGANSQFVIYVNGIFFPSSILGFVEIIHNNTTSNTYRENNQYVRVGFVPATPSTSNVFSNGELRICEYSKSGKWKSTISNMVSENNSNVANNSRNGQWSGLIRTNDPITRITSDGGREIAVGSTMSLYGII